MRLAAGVTGEPGLFYSYSCLIFTAIHTRTQSIQQRYMLVCVCVYKIIKWSDVYAVLYTPNKMASQFLVKYDLNFILYILKKLGMK